jgi:endonuclease-3
MKGSYILILKLENDNFIRIGINNKIFFKKGFYLYVGSALNGLEQRINRHLRKNKKIYWHIDYLLKYARIQYIFYKKNLFKEECRIAQHFFKKFKSIEKFGCGDCNCKSHLFYGDIKLLLEIIDELSFNLYFNAKI